MQGCEVWDGPLGLSYLKVQWCFDARRNISFRVSAMVGPRRCATCSRAVFWTCEWLGVEGDLSAPMRPMHRSGRNMKSASRCQATPVGKAASVHMTRDAQGTAVRLSVVGLGFRLDPVSPDLEGRGGGQAIQTIQARLWGASEPPR